MFYKKSSLLSIKTHSFDLDFDLDFALDFKEKSESLRFRKDEKKEEKKQRALTRLISKELKRLGAASFFIKTKKFTEVFLQGNVKKAKSCYNIIAVVAEERKQSG